MKLFACDCQSLCELKSRRNSSGKFGSKSDFDQGLVQVSDCYAATKRLYHTQSGFSILLNLQFGVAIIFF